MRRPSHPTIVSYLALFVALGGAGAYAADTVFSTDIVDGEVRTADLDGHAVTANKLAPGAVGTTRLGDGVVTEPKLADGAVATAKLGQIAVTNDKLATFAVTNDKLAADAVTSSKIPPETIGSTDIGASAVKTSELALGAVTSEDIANGTVAAGDMQPDLITRGYIDKAEDEMHLDGGTFDNRPEYEVLSVTLPPGLYMLAAKAIVRMAIGSGPGWCELRLGSGVLDRARVDATGLDNEHSTDTVPLMSSVNLSRTIAVKLVCQAGLGYDMYVTHRRLMAIRVASLTVTQG